MKSQPTHSSPAIHLSSEKHLSIITPHLSRRTMFEKVLRNYRPSTKALETLAATPFVTLTAPTSTGRNTIIDELVKTGHYYFIVSDTTRPPRYNDGLLEKEGVRYHFRTEVEVLSDIRNGRYIEAEIIHNQQVSGQSIGELETAQLQGKIAINEVDIIGSLDMKRLKDDVVSILALPPDFDEWLRRIKKRTTVSDVELHRRLQQATKLLRTSLQQDFFIFVVNDDFHKAVKQIDGIVRLGVRNPVSEASARALAKELYLGTATYLKEHAPDYPAL